MKPILCIIMAMSILSCTDPIDPMNPDEKTDSTKSSIFQDTLWKLKINEDTSFGITKDILISREGVIANFLLNENSKISHFTNFGELSWTWAELMADYVHILLDSTNGNIINKTWDDRIAINVSTGMTEQWITSDYPSTPRGFILENMFYFEEVNKTGTESVLLRAPLENLAVVDTILSIPDSVNQNSLKSIESLNLYKTGSGEDVILFQRRMAKPNRIDLVAYNLSKDEYEWEIIGVDPAGHSSINKVLIVNDNVYLQGLNSIFCINILNGDIVWQKHYRGAKEQFLFDDLTYVEGNDLLVIKSDSESLFIFNSTTGKSMHVTSIDVGYGANKGDVFNTIYYFINGEHELIGYDLESNKVVIKEKSNLHNRSGFRGPIAIDKRRGILYASDSRYMIAFNIKD